MTGTASGVRGGMAPRSLRTAPGGLVGIAAGAEHVQRLAARGAVAGVRAADRAGRRRLVVIPPLAVAARGVRYIRYMGYMAGQPCSGGGLAIRYIRYMTGRCSGCSGTGRAIRYTPVAGLTCGFGCL